jgi:hypothetical protein
MHRFDTFCANNVKNTISFLHKFNTPDLETDPVFFFSSSKNQKHEQIHHQTLGGFAQNIQKNAFD